MTQSATLAPRATHPDFEDHLTPLWRRIAASGRGLARSWQTLRLSRHRNHDVPAATAERLQRQLRTIRSYSRFVRSHPDMPLSHRNHCLDSVVSECEALQCTLTEILE